MESYKKFRYNQNLGIFRRRKNYWYQILNSPNREKKRRKPKEGKAEKVGYFFAFNLDIKTNCLLFADIYIRVHPFYFLLAEGEGKVGVNGQRESGGSSRRPNKIVKKYN